MRYSFFAFIFLSCIQLGTTQNIDRTHPSFPFAHQSLETFKTFLALPNDAHYPEQIEQNVAWCSEKLTEKNFTTQRLVTAGAPLLLATYNKQVDQQPTLLLYIHIDGQPVDSDFWFQDNPYEATLKQSVEGEGWVKMDWSKLSSDELKPDWRIFARSASDDKAPFVMLLTALETLNSQKKTLPYNLKVILDFEEEIGSPNLATAVVKYKEDLAADMLIIFDGPKHLSNEPTIAFGARGITAMTIKVFGPTYSLHSGHYGNYAPNPALRLAELLNSMKDEHGRVTIKGYYDGIELDNKTKAILAAVPDDEQQLRLKLGIGAIDSVGSNYQESIQYPSLNIRGMSSGWIGKEVRTIVPASATAELDLRLVVESDGTRLKQLVRQHIADQGYYILDRKPTARERVQYAKICQIDDSRGVTKAFRTDFDSKLGKWVFNTIEQTFGKAPIRVRTMGGTLPTSPFITTLGVPAVIVPLANSDNNQHSPNENLRLGNYFDGVKTIYSLLNSPF
ncbi:MAG: M20/M25/M40 family metallo-hydrolase [Bacteroidota bacterium]